MSEAKADTMLSPSTLEWFKAKDTSTKFRQAEEFPHVVINNFLNTEVIEKCYAEFPKLADEHWVNYLHYNEKKYGLPKLERIPGTLRQVIEYLNSASFVKMLEHATGINGLIADNSLEGAGLHQIPKGGFLNLHADFTVHPHHRNWRRRVNILIYLNKDWREEYGGHLELWRRDMSECFKKALPVLNRCVIFNTDTDSFHGHPDPITCPEDCSRKSIALYYFTEEERPPIKRATNYQARPNESKRKHFLVALDRMLLSVYNRLKGVLHINDNAVSKILKKISGGK
jgi:Rps23 Pro-64 3,4-dihydroxylase Tpa1-like proline 4-hydroxylase